MVFVILDEAGARKKISLFHKESLSRHWAFKNRQQNEIKNPVAVILWIIAFTMISFHVLFFKQESESDEHSVFMLLCALEWTFRI